MERVRELAAAANERDYDPLDVKTLLPGLEPWLRASELVQSMQTLCAHDKTQLRFWLPAQCFKDGPERFEEHLKRGLVVVQRPAAALPATTEDDEWSKGALLVECCVISTRVVTDFESAKVVRAVFRVYPQCAQCGVVEGATHVCAGCKVPFYCGVECQRAHWTVHKVKCQMLRMTMTTTEEKK